MEESTAHSPSASAEGGAGPHHYFVVFTMRKDNDSLRHLLVQGLIQDAVIILGSGTFQVWQNEVSVCFRILCKNSELEKFESISKTSMKIFGFNPSDVAVYRSWRR